jgi:hypothetical protein
VKEEFPNHDYINEPFDDNVINEPIEADEIDLSSLDGIKDYLKMNNVSYPLAKLCILDYLNYNNKVLVPELKNIIYTFYEAENLNTNTWRAIFDNQYKESKIYLNAVSKLKELKKEKKEY